MRKLIKSFGFAFQGLAYAFKTQLNFKIHLFVTALVSFGGWYFKLSIQDWLWIVLAIGMVLSAELLNTAIEVLVDLISPELHRKAGIIKDVAAGAVLFAALAALIIGLLIFIPKLS